MHRQLKYFIFILFLFLIGCGDTNIETNKDNNKLEVYTTVFPLKYFAERIGGDYVQVSTIYPPGTDEHTYEPSQQDMMKLSDSDLFIYIGLGLESFVNKAENILKNDHVKMVAAGEHLEIYDSDHLEEEEEHDGHSHGDIDPHVWIDPLYSKDLSNEILTALTEKKPEHKDEFEDNFKELVAELDELDDKFKAITENAKRNQIVVAHAAYGYWEKRYGIEQIPIAGISTTDEPSQKKLQLVVDLINKNEIPFILTEQNIHSKMADVIMQETGTEQLSIHNLSVLTEEDLKNNETYFSLMERNIEVLNKALN